LGKVADAFRLRWWPSPSPPPPPTDAIPMAARLAELKMVGMAAVAGAAPGGRVRGGGGAAPSMEGRRLLGPLPVEVGGGARGEWRRERAVGCGCGSDCCCCCMLLLRGERGCILSICRRLEGALANGWREDGDCPRWLEERTPGPPLSSMRLRGGSGWDTPPHTGAACLGACLLRGPAIDRRACCLLPVARPLLSPDATAVARLFGRAGIWTSDVCEILD
jgi:hypothetical protein